MMPCSYHITQADLQHILNQSVLILKGTCCTVSMDHGNWLTVRFLVTLISAWGWVRVRHSPYSFVILQFVGVRLPYIKFRRDPNLQSVTEASKILLSFQKILRVLKNPPSLYNFKKRIRPYEKKSRRNFYLHRD